MLAISADYGELLNMCCSPAKVVTESESNSVAYSLPVCIDAVPQLGFEKGISRS